MSAPSHRTSIWPAATVLIVALSTLALFMVINAVTNTSTVTTTTVAVVGGVNSSTDKTLTDGCSSAGLPPADIRNALMVPVTVRLTAHKIVNQGAGDYDCYLDYRTSLSGPNIIAYYQTHIPALGWKLFSTGHSSGGHHGQQVLFQIAGSDSFYWVYGVTIESTGTSTNFRIRIYQNNSLI
jgi:hypothetical protein